MELDGLKDRFSLAGGHFIAVTICQVYRWLVFNYWVPKVTLSEILFICLPGRHYFSSGLNRNSFFLPMDVIANPWSRCFIAPSIIDCIDFVGKIRLIPLLN